MKFNVFREFIASKPIQVLILRRVIGGLVIFLGVSFAGAAGVMLWMIPQGGASYGVVLPSIAAVSAAVIGIGIAIVLRRLRGLCALLCFIGFVPAAFGTIWFSTDLIGADAPHLESFVDYPAFLAAAFIFGYAVIFLLWPDRGEELQKQAARRPDHLTETNWRDWLLGSLAGASLERAPDRFIETVLASFLLIGTYTGVYLTGMSVSRTLGRAIDYSLFEVTVTPLRWLVVAAICWIIISNIVATPLILRLFRLTLQTRARNAEAELLQPGSRRPILYLRSFELDRHKQEFALAQQLRRCGPVIAIGRPGERLPELGAARFYAAEDRWQDAIADAVRVSQLVVWTSGTTEGLAWELRHLLATLPPERLIVWAHPHLLSLNEAGREAEWRRFLAVLGGLFPKALPARLGDTRFFHFGPDFAPVPIAPRPRWPWLARWPWLSNWLARRRSPANHQRSACQALFAAMDLPRPDPVLQTYRRHVLRIASASAGAVVLTISGAHKLGEWIDHRGWRVPDLRTQTDPPLGDDPRDDPKPLPAPDTPDDDPDPAPPQDDLRQPRTALTTMLANIEDSRVPWEVVGQHTAMLSWTDQQWMEQFQASADAAGRLRPFLAGYAGVFQRARQMPAIEALLYGSGSPLYAGLKNSQDAARRLNDLAFVLAPFDEIEMDLRAVSDGTLESDGTFRARLKARMQLLTDESTILQMLVDNPGAWSLVPAADSGVLVPEFTDPDLQARLFELAKSRFYAIEDLLPLWTGAKPVTGRVPSGAVSPLPRPKSPVLPPPAANSSAEQRRGTTRDGQRQPPAQQGRRPAQR